MSTTTAYRAPGELDFGPVTLHRPTGPMTLSLREGLGVAEARLLPGLCDTDGEMTDGALAVLVDEALGFSALSEGPAGKWSVSSDIGLEVLCPPRAGELVRAEARKVSSDDVLSYTECRVLGEDGRLLARANQRGRYVLGDPEAGLAGEGGPLPEARDIVDLLGLTEHGAAEGPGVGGGEGAGVELTVGASTRNLQHALHGGVSLLCSMLAAKRELTRQLAAGRGSPGLRPISARITYPRGTPDGERILYRATARHVGRSFAVLDVAGVADGKLRTWAQVSAHPVAQAPAGGLNPAR